MSVYKVRGESRFVEAYAEYTNGVDTSGGLYGADELEPVDGAVAGISYDSGHATELPVDWHDRYVLDDNDRVQRIKDIHWDRVTRRYEMEDGSFSEEVVL